MNTESGKIETNSLRKNYISRRNFIGQSTIYGGALLAAMNRPRPLAFAAAEASSKLLVFSERQWRTVEAITGRIIPTDHEPGAIEANCVNFIDKALANEDNAQQPIYESGLAGVDTVSRKRFDAEFTDLTEAQQDEILISLESDDADGWPEKTAAGSEFFSTVRTHTIIGFLADPKYGGNRDYAGWKVIGYPGPSHHSGGYTRPQLIGQEPIKPIWEQPHH